MTDLDERLREHIHALLVSADCTAKYELRVGVLNGIAHLAGTVDSMMTRTAAEDLARNVAGVRGVVNRIEAPGAPSPAREINLELKDDN